MATFPFPLTKTIHENLSIVMTFAFSRSPLVELLEIEFRGEWEYLGKALLDISEQRAHRACPELAVLLRTLDDVDPFPENMKTGGGPGFGDLFHSDGSQEHLTLRDVSNKIIHAARVTCDFSRDAWPVLTCHPEQNQKWVRAEVHSVQVAAACGNIMS